jgi:hypothetical protein
MGMKIARSLPTLSTFRSNALTGTATDVKTTGGEIFGWYAYNDGAATNYLQIYGAVSGGGSPLFTIGIPTKAATNIVWPGGVIASTGISLKSTTDYAASAGSTTGEMILTLVYL